MSSFEVRVCRVTIEPHPDSEAQFIEVGRVDGYISVVGKDSLKTGDLAVYIPEQAIVPAWILQELELEGKLAGPDHNRVKAVRLRKQLSQGLLWKPKEWKDHWVEGAEIAAEVGITKWVPEVPAQLRGLVEGAPHGFRGYVDIEDLKRFPGMFAEGDPVQFTEKLHGSCLIAALIDGHAHISSKGVGGRHLVIKEDANNAYWRVASELNLHNRLQGFLAGLGQPRKTIILYGEMLGVQDLKYGLARGKLGYAAFDVWLDDQFVSPHWFQQFCRDLALPAAPVLYEGPFSWEVARTHASGQSTLAAHIREGIVIRPMPGEQLLPTGERKIAKLVSPEYLTRGGETTEFE